VAEAAQNMVRSGAAIMGRGGWDADGRGGVKI
jgi:hypothetical protein